MVYNMAWRSQHDIIEWSGGHGMVTVMAWRASHGICIGLASYGMVYLIVWWVMAWYGLSGMK